MATYFQKGQSLSSSYVVESTANNMMTSTVYMNNNNNNTSYSSSSSFQANGEKHKLQENDFNSWRDNQLLLLHGGGTQELSLSLSPRMQMPPPPPYLGCSISAHALGSDNLRLQEDEHLGNLMQIDHVSPHGGHAQIPRSFPSSKYLKVAQELLDEVVNVRKALKQRDSNMELDDLQQNKDTTDNTPPRDYCSGSKVRTEFSSGEKHNLQDKLTKLAAMLDEVDRRYKQYYNQMQIVVSSFETITGTGTARPYTALAVQTISRHFRSLRDAITGQMKSTRKSLGEEEDLNRNVKGIGISRLRHVDQQLRQQKALQQQLGIMQQNAWRPQRGLPENSVSILRAWLFEHFLHPYPKDSDKIVLARETGLTRNQVSNWFINARVRLWKPMVEEMYKEEFGIAAEMGSKSPSDNNVGDTRNGSYPASGGGVEDMEMVPGSLTISEMDHDGSVFPDAIWFGSNGGGVSLTLGLQNLGDNYRIPISTGDLNHQFNNTVTSSDIHVFNTTNVGAGASSSSGVPGDGGIIDFGSMNSGNRRQQSGFAANHLLLHDFVA